ncbi:hypothetical protein F7734_50675 [Scytonema sp. UIC 10036]|uniref:hypothetical protein n=1 Tax=Scytonema sp. UIC 10036 TaxID=2304196 RepID=UPI0012DA29BC|nr:hypothetical protein [Scytonema sp. UIC 10036]MUH00106.1 hypothetical protein [Scytonema sp. UIC 10036]
MSGNSLTVRGAIASGTLRERQLGQYWELYVLWLLPILGLTSIAFVLEAYFLGLTEGETVRNVSLIAFLIGFAPTVIAAYQLHSNHILWLALCLFLAGRIVGFGVQLPRTFKTNIEAGHLPALETSCNLPMSFGEELAQEIITPNLEV